jgi:hypothetical protein
LGISLTLLLSRDDPDTIAPWTSLKQSDRFILEELDVEQRKLPLNKDLAERTQIWREIFALRDELERRYPPPTDPLA